MAANGPCATKTRRRSEESAEVRPSEIRFPNEELRARFVRLQIPSAQPIFFHLDEVEVYGPEAPNLALHRPADQSSLSQWSTPKRLGGTNAPRRLSHRGRSRARTQAGRTI